MGSVRVSTPLFSAPPPANLCKMDDPSLQDVIALLESARRAEILLDDPSKAMADSSC
jgi:hypothetical protein